MLVLIITLSISILINVFLGRKVWLFMQREEQLEFISHEQEQLVTEIVEQLDHVYEAVSATFQRMVAIDHAGAFRADDDVGFVFRDLKDTLGTLASFMGVEEANEE